MKVVPEKADVMLAKAGDKAAMTRVLAAMAPLITYFARRFGRAVRADVNDLTQLGVLAVYDATRTFNPDKKRAFSWHATQWLRSRMGYALARERKRCEVSTEDSLSDGQVISEALVSTAPRADELIIRDEALRWLRLAIARIEMPVHREIMLQRAAGADYATIGRSIGYSREYVRQVVMLHMKVLSETLERDAA